MKEIDDIISEDRFLVKAEIVSTIERICTGDWQTCNFGYCIFNKDCAKPLYKIDKLPDRSRKLKSILKHAKRKERRKLGIIIPNLPKSKDKKIRKSKYKFSWESVSEILGQDIREHELIKGHAVSLKEVSRIENMTDLINMLQKRHKKVHGKKLSLPSGRYLYWKYKNES